MHVEYGMPSNKPNVARAGRRLRRSLGGLLALGFGVAWWALVPETVAAAPPPPKPIGRVVQVVRVPVVVTVPIAVEPPKPRLKIVVKKRHPVHVTTPVVIDPIKLPEFDPVAPVVDPPDPDAIAPQPVVEIPTPVDDEPLVLPPIRTRPS